MDSPDIGAPWLNTALELVGTREFPGGENNPVILGWARFIGTRYPEMAAYCDLYKHDATAWCGLEQAYALAKNGVRPPFGATDTKRFLWANSFADPEWGEKLATWRRGAIGVWKWRNGGGHVATILSVTGGVARVVGGNQSDAVTEASFRVDDGQFVGYFWPRTVAAAPAPERTPADVRRRMGKAITLAEARRDAQGNLALYHPPANDGGGAYEIAGINVRWHPVAAAKLKAMLEAKQFAEAEDFVGDYTGSYTDVADVWTSRWGVEFYLRDCVFHRGPTGAAMILQRALLLLGEQLGESGDKGDGVDGDVGPLTMDALGRQERDVERLLAALRQAREDYEREDVGVRANLWNGLINRFTNALVVARRFHAEQPKESQPVSTDPAQPADMTAINNSIKAMIAMQGETNALVAELTRKIAGDIATAPVTLPVVVAPPAPAPSILDKPGVGLAASGLGLSALLQWAGGIDVTQGGSWGQLLPLASTIIGGLGVTGTFGTALSALGKVGAVIGKISDALKTK
jgi:uncharacterized protein (TIGR02594 family)